YSPTVAPSEPDDMGPIVIRGSRKPALAPAPAPQAPATAATPATPAAPAAPVAPVASPAVLETRAPAPAPMVAANTDALACLGRAVAARKAGETLDALAQLDKAI